MFQREVHLFSEVENDVNIDKILRGEFLSTPRYSVYRQKQVKHGDDLTPVSVSVNAGTVVVIV